MLVFVHPHGLKSLLGKLDASAANLTLEELRCRVGGTATERVQLVARSELVTEPKVGDFDVHLAV